MDACEPSADRPSYEELERRVGELEAEVEKLTKQFEEALRAGKRQAAPFRKEEPTEPLKQAKRRKKPGRKSGDEHGEHRRREEPPTEPDEVHRAELPECCPHCDSKQLEATKIVTQTQVELPTKPIVRRFDIEVGECRSCGKRVQGRHELQTSDSIGAAKHQLGSRAHAVIAWLNKRLGLSHGKVAELFDRLLGVKISRSTSCRSMLRSATKSGRAEEDARALVRGSPAIAADKRFAKFLRNHADQLFTFLRPERLGVVAATNWRAEQAIRPAVVNRKVRGGNRTERGADAQATLSTVIVTLAQQELDPIPWLARARQSVVPLPLTG